jgi:hypothetical protein
MLRTHRPAMRFLLCLLLLSFTPLLRAEEPLLKPNDVVVLVGGEDMVVASELGYLEALVQQALPQHRLKFRSLAWEGDTVFEQRRDLNYPNLEAQLDKIGATVVMCGFGPMERKGGYPGVAHFKISYGKLLHRLAGGSSRRVVILSPRPLVKDSEPTEVSEAYSQAIREVAAEQRCQLVDVWSPPRTAGEKPSWHDGTRDGVHLDRHSQRVWALFLAKEICGQVTQGADILDSGSRSAALIEAIAAKNRLWFNYARPQNWAFLAGDRTNQPSSRDHIDRNKRWFTEELEKFVPLIEAKEKEVWELAAKLKR